MQRPCPTSSSGKSQSDQGPAEYKRARRAHASSIQGPTRHQRRAAGATETATALGGATCTGL
eukprot:10421270-Lingulodinium_polyedra.AAC.1